MDPREIFAQSGLPQPSSFPTREVLGLQSAKLSKQILSTWNTLRGIIQRREASLRKRWMKRTREQRKTVLQTVSILKSSRAKSSRTGERVIASIATASSQ
jgi:hypothetical protein